MIKRTEYERIQSRIKELEAAVTFLELEYNKAMSFTNKDRFYAKLDVAIGKLIALKGKVQNEKN